MSTIIFTAGAKGGTGKSTAVRLLITYLRAQGFNPALLDMDDESKTLSRFFPEAQKVNIREPFSHNILVKKALSGEKLVIADLKGGTGGDTIDWWTDLPFEELSEIKFICLASVTSSPDSVQSFMSWVAALQNRVSYVVCKNQKDGNVFPDYDGVKETLIFRETYNPEEVLVTRLHEIYMTELERLNLTIAEVLEANGSETINDKNVGQLLSGILERAHLRRFQNSVYNQFKPVLNLLKL